MNAFIAVDWGTTNRRIYRVEKGRLVAATGDRRGATSMRREDYPEEVAAIRRRLGDLPMLLVGMVGSTIGWRDVPYVRAPAGVRDIAANLERVDERTAIVPGIALSEEGRLDVMRGEEVQFIGALAANMVPARSLVCQPGTHAKWARLAGGRIETFKTAMTGEIFALLKAHSVLAGQLAVTPQDDPAFAEGVHAGARGDLLGGLFAIRAGSVLGARDVQESASFASGMLIGADVAARDVEGRQIHLLAEPELGGLYARAINLLGGNADLLDSQLAFVAGATAINRIFA